MDNLLAQEKSEEFRQITKVIAYKMAIPLYFIFWALDLLYVPQYKWEFLAIRSLIVPTVLITHWWLNHTTGFVQAERAGLFMIFMCATILNIMIYKIGSDQLYVILLQLVAIGGLTYVPWSRRYFIAAIFAIYLPYYVIELGRIKTQANHDFLFVISFFIGGVIVITQVIRNYREKLRHRERQVRNNLEKEVTQRKQTEQDLIVARDQALAATRAKEAFLANMSHEIRTPLTAIIGFAEYSLDNKVTEPERQAALKTIASSGNHLLNIINDILDFSKIEADSIKLEKHTLDPFQLVGEVQSLVMPLANKKELLIKLEYDFPLPVSIKSDSMRIKQILINLCSNAIKFSEKGSVVLSMAFDTSSNSLIYRVKDSGIGMTAQQTEQIFEPFKQADTSIARRYGGTGLGLSLSKRLATMLGGSVSVHSEPDVGSEFTLTIDAGQDSGRTFIDHIEQLSEYAAQTPEESDFKNLAGDVLLAEDNENNQHLLSLYLTKMGLKVTTADNGKIALEQSRNKNYDLILMDMQMPVMSGVEATRQLRESGYLLPIIALTANTTEEDRRLCLDSGCNDFLTKPITREQLYQIVAQYVSEQQNPPEDTQPLYSTLMEEEPDIGDIVLQFIDQLPETIDNIRNAYEIGDRKKLKDLVHNLKGMGGGFGYPQLSDMSKKIEQLLLENNIEAIGTVIGEMDIVISRIKAGKPHIDNRTRRISNN